MRKPLAELNTSVPLTKQDFIEIFKVTSINIRVLLLLSICCILAISGVIFGLLDHIGEAIICIMISMSLYMLRYLRDSWYLSAMLENTYIYGDDDYTIRYKYEFTNVEFRVRICHRFKNEEIIRDYSYKDLKKILYSKNHSIIITKNGHFLYLDRDSEADNYFSKKLGRRRYQKTNAGRTKYA